MGRKLILEHLEDRRMLAAINWEGDTDGDGIVGSAGDNTLWMDTRNWDLRRVPAATDDVTIGDAFSGTTIELATTGSERFLVNSIDSAAQLRITEKGRLQIEQDSRIASLILEGVETNFGTSLSTSVFGGRTLVIDGDLVWNQAVIFNIGIDVGGDLTIATTRPKSLNAASITASGSNSTWSGGDVSLFGSVIINRGMLTMTSNADFPANSPAFINAGGATLIHDAPVDGNDHKKMFGAITNNGLVEVRQGKLEFGDCCSPVTNHGRYIVNPGAELVFNGNLTFSERSEITSLGTGTLSFQTQPARIEGVLNASSTVNITAAVDFANDVSIPVLNFDSGVATNITGPGNLTITDRLNWMSGGFQNTTVASLGDAVLGTPGESGLLLGLSGATFANRGDATWRGADFQLAGTLHNRGLFRSESDNGISLGPSSFGQIFNDGTWISSSPSEGAVEKSRAVPFTNRGDFTVEDAAVRYQTFNQESGTLTLDNSTLTIANPLPISGGTVQGEGSIVANVNQSGGTIGPGASPGLLTVDGDYNATAGGLSVEISGPPIDAAGNDTAGDNYDQLVVTGRAVVANLEVKLVDEYQPSLGDRYTVLTADSVTGPTRTDADSLGMQVLASDAAIELEVIRPLNPLADPGGPYVADEGTEVTFQVPGSDSEIRLTVEDAELADLINQYRNENGLPSIPISASLTQVAQLHVRDLFDHQPQTGECNLHSWSANGDWTPVCYTPDHANATGMWSKPSEITDGAYAAAGYEIASQGVATSHATVYSRWASSPGHNDIILNQGIWGSRTWEAMGAASHQGYRVVWFGELSDPLGAPDDPLVHEWDFDYDGTTFDIDASGIQHTRSFPDEFAPRRIALRVTNLDEQSNIATTTLQVDNVEPMVVADPPLVINRAGDLDVTLEGLFEDPGPLDSHTIAIDWGDTSPPSIMMPDVGERDFQATHRYPKNLTDQPITYSVTVTVSDNDGGQDTATVSVDIPPTTTYVAGVKFHDVNGNGVRDVGEPGLAGWTITIQSEGPFDPQTAVTDENGEYRVTVSPGTYRVFEQPQEGWAQTFPEPSNERVSVSSDGTSGNHHSTSPSISGAGRFVVFASLADNLVANDNNGVSDVFLRDRWLGETILISVDPTGRQGNLPSYEPVISATGRWVAFVSEADLIPDRPARGIPQVYLYDRHSGDLRLVSLGEGQNPANAAATTPAIAEDPSGYVVAFQSAADNLVAGDRNGLTDVFVFADIPESLDGDFSGGRVTRASVGSDGSEANGSSADPTISIVRPHSQFVAVRVGFESSASTLVADDSNQRTDVFVRTINIPLENRVTGAYTERASKGSGRSFDPSLSFPGVSFVTTSTVTPAGGTGNKVVHRQFSAFGPLSGEGPDLVAEQSDSPHTRHGRTVYRASRSFLGSGGSRSADDILTYDPGTDATAVVSVAHDGGKANRDSFQPALSDAGISIVFGSYADNLVADDGNNAADIFVRDLFSPYTLNIERGDQFEGIDFGNFNANPAPTIDAIDDVTLPDTSPGTTILMSGITDGGDGSQNVSITIDQPNQLDLGPLFYDPTEGTATLSVHPQINLTGDFEVTVTLSDDGSPSRSKTTSFTVHVTGVNDPPQLDASREFYLDQIAPGELDNNGTLIADILASGGEGAITDPDSEAQSGIAIVTRDEHTWQYSTNNGGTWRSVLRDGTNRVTLLAADSMTRLRVLPNVASDLASLTFRAWDQSAGINGGFIPAEDVVGALSSEFGTARLWIHEAEVATNSRPVLNGVGPLVFDPDVALSIDDLLASFGSAAISDPDPGALLGIAISEVEFPVYNEFSLLSPTPPRLLGAWEYSRDGGSNWNEMASCTASQNPCSDSMRLLLAADGLTEVRYRSEDVVVGPVDQVDGFPALRFHGWDRTFGANGSLVESNTLDLANTISIETAPAVVALDEDQDGVPAFVEDAAPNNGDGNNDGQPDSDQKNVASLPNAATRDYITIVAPETTTGTPYTLADVQTTDNPSNRPLPAGVVAPFGFIGFTVEAPNTNPFTVDILLPADSEVNSYFKYGPLQADDARTPIDESAPEFYLFNLKQGSGAEFTDLNNDGTSDVRLHLVDGGRGDADLIVDGWIVDPGAPTWNPEPTIDALTITGDLFVGEPLSLDATFTDSGDDSHSATIDWGDGTVEPATVDETAGMALGTHIYAQHGSYEVRVEISDSNGSAAELTQAVDIVSIDFDGDGVLNTVEDGAPNNGDGNDDGVLDSQQSNVASLPNAGNGSYVSIISQEGTTLRKVQAVNSPDPRGGGGRNFPVRFFEYEVHGVPVAGTSEVRLTGPDTKNLFTYWKYGPEPNRPRHRYYVFYWDGQIGARNIDGELVLLLKDGGRGDDDLTQNGIIVDPGGPAFASSLWQHPFNPADVDGDGYVAPQDALLVINELNNSGSRQLLAAEFLPGTSTHLDTDGDGFLAPMDVLVVIKELNAAVLDSAEGESVPYVLPPTLATGSRIPVSSGQAENSVHEGWEEVPEMPIVLERDHEEIRSTTESTFALASDEWLEPADELEELLSLLASDLLSQRRQAAEIR